MKRFTIIIGLLWLTISCASMKAQEVTHMTGEEFRKEIFDYHKKTKWEFNSKKPVIIDFYATWCGPCRRVAPIFEKLQQKYGKKIKFYKVNVDKERELVGVLGIRSMPTFVFIPKKGRPVKIKGAMTEKEFVQYFHEIFGM